MTYRIGFACKYVDERQQLSNKLRKDIEQKYNFKTTTVKHLKSLNNQKQYDKLFDLIRHNMYAFSGQLEYLNRLSPNLRMMRIGSDILPLYSHPEFSWFYDSKDVKTFLLRNLEALGTLSRNNDCRLSFHPGQYCVLSSDKSNVIENSIKEFEYHADVARMMGYKNWHQDGFSINVHVGSRKGGIERLRKTISQLSETAKNLITIENDEISFDIDEVLKISDMCPIVLDIHHQLISSNEYIKPNDVRFKKVIESWKGVRPKIHFSSSKESLIENLYPNDLPDMNYLLEQNFNKQKLRAHSEMCWNNNLNDWALSFIEDADIMVEAKQKNLASIQLYHRALSKGILKEF